MPLIRKIFRVHEAKVISLPKSWLDWLERKYGCEIREVAVEVDEELKISPIIPSAKSEKCGEGCTIHE